MNARPGRLVLLGHPVEHSLSPLFQNAALRAAGIPIEYTTWDVTPDALAAAVRRLRDEAAAGNVTVPHKASVAALCDRVTPVAERAAAVNTFWVERSPEGNCLVGDNTDVAGVSAALVALVGTAPRNARVLLLGAGGAASAVLCALEQWPGNSVVVQNRDAKRAAALVARFATIAQCSDDARELADADIVINATSLGLRPQDPLPCDPARVQPGARVLDLVYRPGGKGTAWVQAAAARGLAAMDGTTMLVEQGAAAFERWFGITPDRAVMWSALGR